MTLEKLIITVEEINLVNANFWVHKTHAFKERVAKRPSDLEEAVKQTRNDLLRNPSVGFLRGLEERVFEYQEREEANIPAIKAELKPELKKELAAEIISERQSHAAMSPRKLVENQITKFMRKKLSRNSNMTAKEMAEALKTEAENGTEDGSIQWSQSDATFYILGNDTGGNMRHRMKESSIPAIMTRLKKDKQLI